ncbi:murein transglycosylase [Brevundimonas sp. Leaf363]|uniref:MltA domain-containing protein n=1 Tax=Brevundimonas sp. Leaf363 TaxID=1736353 RepID=UPI0006F56058|nr:MltA domain-containing protein [Brevundimonas sp. Leaf363]KQS57276.1 murein transglycosylase [Brevundimonas sp. Leaf363]
MRFSGLAVGLVLGAALAGCATPPAPAPVPPPDTAPGPVSPPDPDEPVLPPTGPHTLPGWSQEDHLAAFMAYVEGCGVAREAAAVARCNEARLIQQTSKPVTPTRARDFFERGFDVVAAETADGRPGMLTSYFAPEYTARHAPGGDYDAPILGRPSARDTRPRVEIEADPGAAEILGWMRTEDLFFLQIQGSGYLDFGDGEHQRAAYAGDNGQPFRGIARQMADQGLLPPNGTSGEAIRAWLDAHRGPQAKAVTALNPRYIFFRLDPDDGGQPAGAAGVPLTPRRAIAVDPASWRYGDLVWVEADGATLPGARRGYQGLVMALDTGSAIRGPVRADLYMGRGAEAGEEAGSVRHPLRMWRLVPRP